MKNKIDKLFLFDIDGVLNKSEYFTIQFERDFEINSELFSHFFNTEFEEILRGKVRIEEILPKYFEEWDWQKSVDEFLAYWFANDIRIDEELVCIIEAIQADNHKIGIASHQEFRRKNYLLQNKGLNEIFDINFFSCDSGFLKTENEFYLNIKKEFDGEIYFWDDTLEVVNVANRNGLKAFHYINNLQFKNQISAILNSENEF